MSKNCPYCDNSLDMNVKRGYQYLCDEEFYDGMLEHTAMISTDNKLCLCMRVGHGDEINVEVPINFCPKCGRKLN